ncbi:AAA family ATPase [Thermoleptolyngbya oregonensis NK1-22]|uniref:AAA family ATPase n=1 Tax=Thermoleptolyngbya oregonensis NK1-22 TaxID=2547457 RepID=A0AA96Y5Y4_9CYAN|nr:AAA family ATPase [Thermoleptolyngbya oregonensis NK1-22]
MSAEPLTELLPEPPTGASAGFADNWSYLKTELGWLERMLMVAVARQKKEAKEIDRVAQSRADRVTSHWWQGVISLDGKICYDEYRQPPATTAVTTPRPSYQQQLEGRIRATEARGVLLGLPMLCDRLQLSLFEKQVILLAIAPEVNRRYARLYRFLQGEESAVSDLPTVNLALQLLCRNDQEWRVGRSRLLDDAPLLKLGLLERHPRNTDTLLNQSLRLAAPLVSFLLDEQPQAAVLDRLLQPATVESFLTLRRTDVPWDALVLPESLIERLRSLCDLASAAAVSPTASGPVAVLAGPSGVGKTLAAEAIAHTLGQPLATVDLSQVSPADFPLLLQDIESTRPPLLLVKSAQLWLRRSAAIAPSEISRLLSLRQEDGTLTLFSLPHAEAIALPWQRQLRPVLSFAMPDAAQRLQIWQQTELFPQSSPIDWEALAKQLAVSGGEIRAIAQTARQLQLAKDAPLAEHLQRAIALRGHSLSLPLRSRSRGRKVQKES